MKLWYSQFSRASIATKPLQKNQLNLHLLDVGCEFRDRSSIPREYQLYHCLGGLLLDYQYAIEEVYANIIYIKILK